MNLSRSTIISLRNEVQNLVKDRGHAHAAKILHAMGISFGDAYRLIFLQDPRPLDADALDLDFTTQS